MLHRVRLSLLRTQTNLFPNFSFWFSLYQSRIRPFGVNLTNLQMSEHKIIKDEKGKKFTLSRPPDDVFLYRKVGVDQHNQQQDAMAIPASQNEIIPMLDQDKGYNGVTYPETGGQYVWHIGREHPRKGHVYPEALRDCYYPKRIFVN